MATAGHGGGAAARTGRHGTAFGGDTARPDGRERGDSNNRETEKPRKIGKSSLRVRPIVLTPSAARRKDHGRRVAAVRPRRVGDRAQRDAAVACCCRAREQATRAATHQRRGPRHVPPAECYSTVILPFMFIAACG